MPFRAGRDGVRLAGHLPAADGGGVEIAPRLIARPGAAMRHVVGPLEHLRLLGAIEHVAGFEHADLRARERQHVRGDASAGAGADNDDVVCFRSGFYLGHVLSTFIIPLASNKNSRAEAILRGSENGEQIDLELEAE